MDGLSVNDYKKIQGYIYDKLGIDVDEKKKETVTTKIVKLMRRHGMKTPDEYINYVTRTSDSEMMQEFFNEITTNTTEFFREVAHFDYIRSSINKIIDEIPRIKKDGEIRLWSAPCSSGEEPVTLAVVLKECLPHWINIKILATDISEKILYKAVKGVYTENECRGISNQYLLKYFDKNKNGFYEVNSDIKKVITYRLFNLMDDFNFAKGFDIIFCRNLMIYQNNEVQEKLVNKLYNQLVANGLFFIGHSESMLNKKHKFKYVQTAVYKK
ncbi:MAG: protein-glutamate O-methyltransferase CheR [Oscillospiraceae bacterium]|nr:protein-glutamate O-methyltransferase CheR [Oscillospiraceae bacterium]